jgi:hypothetical protein
VSRTSSNTTLIPLSKVVLGGSGANRTVTVTPATGQTGTATITISVNDGGKVTSDTFVVTVTDGAAFSGMGVTSATPLPTVESDDPLVTRTGNWLVQTTSNASGGSYLYSSAATDALQVTFEGSRVEIVYVQHQSLGTFAVEIDGALVQIITATGPTAFEVHAVVDGLSAGSHVLRVYPLSGVIAIDAFLAQATAPVTSPTPQPTFQPQGNG